MSIEGIIASIVIFVIGVVYVMYPMSKAHRHPAQKQDRQNLLNAYERLLSRLRDLDEDYHLGKMPQLEYQMERTQLAQQGATLLAQIEKDLGTTNIRKADQPTMGQSEADTVLDDVIESAIASYIATATQEEKDHAPSR